MQKERLASRRPERISGRALTLVPLQLAFRRFAAMSNSNFESFKTNTEYDEPDGSSSSSSQSTEATDISYNYPDPSFQQVSGNCKGYVPHLDALFHPHPICIPRTFLSLPETIITRLRLIRQPQTRNNVGQNSLFNHIGYGAPDAFGGILPNPNAPVQTNYGSTGLGPSPSPQPQNCAYHPEPWSPFTGSQAYASYSYPNVRRTSTQGKCRVV